MKESTLELLCNSCGLKFDLAEDFSRSKVQCPDCGAMCGVPARTKGSAPKKTAPAPPKQSPRAPPKPPPPEELGLPRPTKVDEIGDAAPYQFSGGQTKRCPKCKKEMPADAVLCVACGFDQRYRAKASKERQPVYREWDNGWSLAWRVRIYFVCQVIVLASLTTGLLTEGDPGVLIPAGLFGSCTLLFLLGTFNRVIVRRGTKGKAQVWNLWRIGFLPRPEKLVPLGEYDRVQVGIARGADFWDWIFLLFMCGTGLVPGLIWAYLVIFKTRYFASLTGSGGFVEQHLYRGTDKQRAQEIGRVISDTVGMSYDGF